MSSYLTIESLTKKSSLKKVTLVLSVATALVTLSSTAKNQEYDNMHKQLNIMNDILRTSLDSLKLSKRHKVRSVQSTYLKGQGVVFTIDSGSSMQWRSEGFSFVMPTMPPVPIAPGSDNNHVREIEIVAENFEEEMELFEQEREGVRELREQQRDIAYKLRDVERDKRDIEYQIRLGKDKSALKEEMKLLAKEQATLKKSKDSLDAKAKKIAKEQKQQKSKKAKQRATYFQKINTTLVETLCLYGNGLKALPKSEYVNLIIKSGGDKNGRGYQDNMIILNKKDISQCAIDKISAKDLLSKASRYQF